MCEIFYCNNSITIILLEVALLIIVVVVISEGRSVVENEEITVNEVTKTGLWNGFPVRDTNETTLNNVFTYWASLGLSGLAAAIGSDRLKGVPPDSPRRHAIESCFQEASDSVAYRNCLTLFLDDNSIQPATNKRRRKRQPEIDSYQLPPPSDRSDWMAKLFSQLIHKINPNVTGNINVFSPKFLGISPENELNEMGNSKNFDVFSPSLFSFRNSSHSILSLPEAFKDFDPSFQKEIKDYILKIAMDESKKYLKKAQLKKLTEYHQLLRDFGQQLKDNHTDDLQNFMTPKPLALKEAEKKVGPKSNQLTKMFQQLYKSFSKNQINDLENKGYSFMTLDQHLHMYAPDGPYGTIKLNYDPFELDRLDGDQKEKLLISHLANLKFENVNSIENDKARNSSKFFQHKRVFKPEFPGPLLFDPEAASTGAGSILEPLMFTSIILQPSVFGYLILSPYLFVPVILSPGVLGPAILSPAVGNPSILSPTVLGPSILSPTVLSPSILSPAVLSPSILSPGVLNPLVLSPLVLNPSILSPGVLNPLILSPIVLSPAILSDCVLCPAILSPAVLS